MAAGAYLDYSVFGSGGRRGQAAWVLCVEATKGEAMSRRRSPVISSSAESAMTWLFAGLVFIALVAGFVGQVAVG
jgi:hypothetical protein